MLDIIILSSVIVILVILHIVAEIRWNKIQQDFLNRIMARDYKEYVAGEKTLSDKEKQVDNVSLSDLLKRDEGTLPVD